MVAGVSVEETVRRIVTRIVRRPDLVFTPDSTFKDFEADSLDIVQILVAIEDTYNIEISDEDLKQVTDMKGFFACIERKMTEKSG